MGTVDTESNVYVADSDNSRIRQITPDGTVSTLAEGGLFGSFADGPVPTPGLIGLQE